MSKNDICFEQIKTAFVGILPLHSTLIFDTNLKIKKQLKQYIFINLYAHFFEIMEKGRPMIPITNMEKNINISFINPRIMDIIEFILKTQDFLNIKLY